MSTIKLNPINVKNACMSLIQHYEKITDERREKDILEHMKPKGWFFKKSLTREQAIKKLNKNDYMVIDRNLMPYNHNIYVLLNMCDYAIDNNIDTVDVDQESFIKINRYMNKEDILEKN